MRRAVGAALAVGIVVSGTGVVRAQDDLSFELPLIGRTTFSLTNTTLIRFRGTNYDANLFDDDFGSLYERLNFSFQADEWRAEGRIDAFVPTTVFVDSPCTIDGDMRCYLEWDLRPERIAVRWEHDGWIVEGGDSQIVIGRGIALSFRKVDLLGIDNALRGGHVRYSGESFRFGLHGGVANPQNQDPITLAIIREPEDVVAGANIGLTLPGTTPLSLGGHAVRVVFADDMDSLFTSRSVDVVGASVEMPALADGALAIYAEANGMRRSFRLIDDARTQGGRAMYGSVQLQLESLTLLVEWKDYTNYLVAPSITEPNLWRIYNASPPVELDGPQRLRGIGNQRGGGVRMDYAFLPGPWSFSLNTVLYGFNEEPNLDAWDGVLVSHSWATLRKRQEYGGDVNFSVDFTGGARFETFLHDSAIGDFVSGQLDRWMIHGRLEITLGSGEHSFDLVVDHRHERETIGGQPREFQIGGASLTYSFGVPLTLAIGFRWTDFEAGVVAARAASEYNFLGGELYPSLEVRYTFTPGTYLGLFAGQTPGGQICSGGVCRDVPTFEGFRLSFVGRL